MAFHNVEKWNFGYACIKFLLQIVQNNVFYRKVETKNREKIPSGVPLIFAPNHQNALMDALSVISVTKGQTVFLARADIFKSPRIASMLYFSKILPVYRMRDGISNLQRNDEVFDRMVDILKKGKQICIFPEGNHDKYRRLRTLSKGMFRIAFKAETDMDFNAGLHIVPTGIDYSNYYKARTKLTIHFGDAIKLADYKEIYEENPQKAINKLRNDLAERMSELMIDIKTEEHYDTYMAVREIYGNYIKGKTKRRKISLSEQFHTDKEVIKKLDEILDQNPAKMDGLHERVSDYTQKLQSLNLKDWLFNRPKYNLFSLIAESFLMLLLSPLFIYGYILNYLLYKIPLWLFKAPKDPQFTTSLRFPVFLFLIPPYYLILLLVAVPFIPFIWLKGLFAVSLPFSGLFAINFYFRLKKLFGKWRYRLLTLSKKTEMDNLKNQRDEIIKMIDGLSC